MRILNRIGDENLTSINLYDKGQVDDKISTVLPSTSGASEGQVLGLDANLNPVWIDAQESGSLNITKSGSVSKVFSTSTAQSMYMGSATLTYSEMFNALKTMLVNLEDGHYTGQFSLKLDAYERNYYNPLNVDFDVTISNGNVSNNITGTSVTLYVCRTTNGNANWISQIRLTSITKVQ